MVTLSLLCQLSQQSVFGRLRIWVHNGSVCVCIGMYVVVHAYMCGCVCGVCSCTGIYICELCFLTDCSVLFIFTSFIL